MTNRRIAVRATALVSLAISFVVAGCSARRPAVEAPEVHVVGIELLEGSMFEQRLAVRLRLRNPNNMDLEIDGFDLLVDVNGSRLARVISDEHVLLPRLGEAIVSSVASTTTADLIRQFQSLGTSGDGRYEITGTAYIGNVLGRSRIDIAEEGSLLPQR